MPEAEYANDWLSQSPPESETLLVRVCFHWLLQNLLVLKILKLPLKVISAFEIITRFNYEY